MLREAAATDSVGRGMVSISGCMLTLNSNHVEMVGSSDIYTSAWDSYRVVLLFGVTIEKASPIPTVRTVVAWYCTIFKNGQWRALYLNWSTFVLEADQWHYLALERRGTM